MVVAKEDKIGPSAEEGKWNSVCTIEELRGFLSKRENSGEAAQP